VHGLVWDVTEFLADHPGGPEVVEAVAGKDCTSDFEDALHSAAARTETRMRLVGVLEGSETQVESWRAKGWTQDQGIPDVDKLHRAGGGTASGGQWFLTVGAAAATAICAAALMLLKARK